VNNVGEPCAGEPHARFDGRALETDAATATEHGLRTRPRETAGPCTASYRRQRTPRQRPTRPTSAAAVGGSVPRGSRPLGVEMSGERSCAPKHPRDRGFPVGMRPLSDRRPRVGWSFLDQEPLSVTNFFVSFTPVRQLDLADVGAFTRTECLEFEVPSTVLGGGHRRGPPRPFSSRMC
jgi:hypothetical protein